MVGYGLVDGEVVAQTQIRSPRSLHVSEYKGRFGRPGRAERIKQFLNPPETETAVRRTEIFNVGLFIAERLRLIMICTNYAILSEAFFLSYVVEVYMRRSLLDYGGTAIPAGADEDIFADEGLAGFRNLVGLGNSRGVLQNLPRKNGDRGRPRMRRLIL